MNDHEETILGKRLALGALPSEEALSHATALAYVLRRMHQEGSVAGAITPDHIMIGPRGARLETDGARLDTSAAQRTAAPTPYTSPEQLHGQGVDARSDIFLFGAIFYEMLAGRKAFDARTPEELRQEILEREPAPVNGISGELHRLLGRCLQKKPEQRWQRMSSVLIELKLAAAAARQAQQASDWKDKMAGLRAQIAGVDGKVAAHESAQETVISDLRNTIRRLETKAAEHAAQSARVQEDLASIRESVAELQRGSQFHTRAIESLEAAIAQTDEVVEHVVDAFGLTQMQKPMVARVEAVSLARNGS